jgi:hypothetical protein
MKKPNELFVYRKLDTAFSNGKVNIESFVAKCHVCSFTLKTKEIYEFIFFRVFYLMFFQPHNTVMVYLSSYIHASIPQKKSQTESFFSLFGNYSMYCCSRDCHRFFDRVGHETMYASSTHHL